MLVHDFSRILKASLSLLQTPNTKQRITRVAEQLTIVHVHVKVLHTFPMSGDNSSLDGALAQQAKFEFTIGGWPRDQDSTSTHHVNLVWC